MTSSYLIEMHDVICVNLYRTKSKLNPQKNGVTGALSTTSCGPNSPNRWKSFNTISCLKGPLVLIYYLFTIYLFGIERITFIKKIIKIYKIGYKMAASALYVYSSLKTVQVQAQSTRSIKLTCHRHFNFLNFKQVAVLTEWNCKRFYWVFGILKCRRWPYYRVTALTVFFI